MLAKNEKVATPCYRRGPRYRGFIGRIDRVLFAVEQYLIDFRDFEASERMGISSMAINSPISIPARTTCQLVVGKHQYALLSLGETR
jgi:hypothetical protein